MNMHDQSIDALVRVMYRKMHVVILRLNEVETFFNLFFSKDFKFQSMH